MPRAAWTSTLFRGSARAAKQPATPTATAMAFPASRPGARQRFRDTIIGYNEQYGRGGNDTLIAGTTTRLMVGGDSRDTFGFRFDYHVINEGVTIADFDQSLHEKIDLIAIDPKPPELQGTRNSTSSAPRTSYDQAGPGPLSGHQRPDLHYHDTRRPLGRRPHDRPRQRLHPDRARLHLVGDC